MSLLYHGTEVCNAVEMLRAGRMPATTAVGRGAGRLVGASLTRSPEVARRFAVSGRRGSFGSPDLRYAVRVGLDAAGFCPTVFVFERARLEATLRLVPNDCFRPEDANYEAEELAVGGVVGDLLDEARVFGTPEAMAAYRRAVAAVAVETVFSRAGQRVVQQHLAVCDRLIDRILPLDALPEPQGVSVAAWRSLSPALAAEADPVP